MSCTTEFTYGKYCRSGEKKLIFQVFQPAMCTSLYAITCFAGDVSFFPHALHWITDLACMIYRKNTLFPPPAFFLTRSKSSVLRRSWSNTTTANTEGPVKLHEGSQVLLTSSNEMGTIRYIGPTDFAPGIWLGLELRSAKGKNDGAVGEKRYFTCKPNHGVLVRPSRVTYRGINGAKLVDDICWAKMCSYHRK